MIFMPGPAGLLLVHLTRENLEGLLAAATAGPRSVGTMEAHVPLTVVGSLGASRLVITASESVEGFIEIYNLPADVAGRLRLASSQVPTVASDLPRGVRLVAGTEVRPLRDPISAGEDPAAPGVVT